MNLIWAMEKNGGIGRGNTLPWHLPTDLMYFKKLTKGNVVVMGRKTFDSIGKPLPGRINVVLSNSEDFHQPGVFHFRNVQQFLQSKFAKQHKVFVIGGAQIYKAFMPHAKSLFITHIHESFEADVFMEIDLTKLKHCATLHIKNVELPHSISIYKLGECRK